MSKLNAAREMYANSLKSLTTGELISRATVPESRVAQGVQAAIVLGVGVYEYMADPIGSIFNAMMYSLATGGVLAVGNATLRSEGRDALCELWSRMTGKNAKEVIADLSFDERREVLEQLSSLIASVPEKK